MLKHRKNSPLVTGAKTFDKLIAKNHLGTGNVLSDAQVSSFIRSKTTTECNGFTNPPGHLREWDLKSYFPQLPQHIKKQVLELTETDDIVLYRFFHWNHGKRIEHGYIATRSFDRNYAFIKSWVTGVRHTSHQILEAVIPYISNTEDFRSVSIREFMEMNPENKQGFSFTLVSEYEESPRIGEEVIDVLMLSGGLPAGNPKDHYLTGDNTLVAVFADGSRSAINYGYRLKVVPAVETKKAA